MGILFASLDGRPSYLFVSDCMHANIWPTLFHRQHLFSHYLYEYAPTNGTFDCCTASNFGHAMERMASEVFYAYFYHFSVKGACSAPQFKRSRIPLYPVLDGFPCDRLHPTTCRYRKAPSLWFGVSCSSSCFSSSQNTTF